MRVLYLFQAIWLACAVAIPIMPQSVSPTSQQGTYHTNKVVSDQKQQIKEDLGSFEDDRHAAEVAAGVGVGTFAYLADQAFNKSARKNKRPSPDSEVGSNTHKESLRKMLHQEHEGSLEHRKSKFELDVAREQGLCERAKAEEWLSTARNEPRPDTLMPMKSIVELSVEVRRKIEAECFEQAFKTVSHGGGIRSAFRAQLELENSRRRRPLQEIYNDQGVAEESNIPELIRGGSSSPEQNQLGDDRWAFNVDSALKDVKQSFRKSIQDLPGTLKQVPAAAMRSNAGVPRVMQAVP